jgi:hypothetical protein
MDLDVLEWQSKGLEIRKSILKGQSTPKGDRLHARYFQEMLIDGGRKKDPI